MIHLRNALAIAAVLLWLTAFVLFLHFADTRPTSPEPVEGRVYPWNDNGRFVYLNRGEQNQLYVLGQQQRPSSSPLQLWDYSAKIAD
jgi:hypothetical protein